MHAELGNDPQIKCYTRHQRAWQRCQETEMSDEALTEPIIPDRPAQTYGIFGPP